MTNAERISWLALIVIGLALLIYTVSYAEASAATATTATQPAVKALCRKCQRPPAPS